MAQQGILVSIQIGKPQTMDMVGDDGRDRSWTSGIFKTPVTGQIWLGKTNLRGDGQADLSVHGGPDKAVMVYSADHYPYWREQLAHLPELPYGAFGENFTIAGLTEDNVCMEDIYRIGEALVQVSDPRQPCWKLARRMQTRKIGPMVIRSGFSGWYMRVLNEGYVEAGLPVELVEQPDPFWTIRKFNDDVVYAK